MELSITDEPVQIRRKLRKSALLYRNREAWPDSKRERKKYRKIRRKKDFRKCVNLFSSKMY